MTNNVLWETWATDPCTFPDKPDPSNPPTWDGCADVKDLHTSSQLSQASDETEQAGALPCDETQIDPTDPHSNCEEVHRNQPAFDFIIRNKLWYTEGLAEAFKSGMNVQFPIQAIEVKANWIPLPPGADKTQYHWNYDQKGDVWVLVGMHIMSKAVPNWTWATWEWEGNPGRCDYLGCDDSFGVNPPNVDSNPQPTPQPYPPGELTSELLSLFQKYNLSPEWQHYRLKGSQTNFIDATGRTTLLGNSYTEAGFVQTSSCIGCHGSAAANAQGLTKFSFAVGPPPAPDTLRSYHGVPDPAWFYDPESEKVTAIPLDFVWAFFKAKSANGAASTSP
jgi:hypothetical protein